jgi:hypothetical protein
MDTKTAADMYANWDAARGRAATNYPLGIDKNTNWHSRAVAGQSTYESAMMNPTVLDRRLTGLQNKTSQADWKQKAKDKGAPRISSGMAAGASKYQAAATVIISTLQGLALPDRTGDAMQNIDNRVKPIATALQQAFGKI